MGRVIAVANQKGGVGKTTTAINLSACLAEKGQKVLAIDMDPQGNMTSGLGIDKDEVEKNIYDLMIGQAGVDEVLQKEAIENLDVIPTSIDLSAAEIELIGVDDKEFIIRNAVQPIKDDYDYIIIDCPPSLSMLTINAMTTADSVLVCPESTHALAKAPNHKSKLLAKIINIPIYGTFIYNVGARNTALSDSAECKYLYASILGHYTTVNVAHCLEGLTTSIAVITGKNAPETSQKATEYCHILPSIEHLEVPGSGLLPQRENANAFLEQLDLLLSDNC